MPRYEITGPDGARYEVTAPDTMPEAAVLERARRELGGGGSEPGAPEMGWGEYFKGLGREAVQGATFDFGDELGLTDRAASQRFGEQHPVMSTVARIAGGVPLFAAGPGAALGRAAMSGGLLRSTAKSAGLGAGAGGVAGLGGGEGGVYDRLPGAAQGAMAGAVLGGAIPPAIAGVGRVAGRVGDALSPQVARLTGAMTRRGEPSFPEPPPRGPVIAGARFVDDTSITPSAESQADQMIANQLLRSGRTVDDLRSTLAESDRSRTFYGGGVSASRAQDTQTLADMDEGLARLAGSAARQSPEVAGNIEAFLTARQTGITPRTRGLSPQAGIAARDKLARRGAGEAPAGQYERVHDAFKRGLTLRDEDFHGHAGNPLRTEQQILQAARDEARPAYRAAYDAGRDVDLRPTIQPILDRWTTRMANEPEPVAAAIRRALRLFQSRGGTVSEIERFDKSKQFMDGVIERFIEAPEGRNRYLGGVLIELKNELLGAVDALPGVGPAYATARRAFSDRMTARDILTRFRDAWRDDAEIGAQAFDDLASPAQQKLARLGLLWGFERQAAGTGRERDVTRVFGNPRIQELLSRVMPRTETATGRARTVAGAPAEYADRPQRFGRLLETEHAQSQMRQRVLGGSQTAERLADDAAYDSMHDVVEMFRANPSVLGLGIRYVNAVLDKLFGMRPDVANAIAVRLFVADPAARERVLSSIAAQMGRSRFEQFSRYMAENQARLGSVLSAQAGAGAGGAPTPQPQQGGPTYL